MNKIVSIKKTSAIFLIIILVTGTINLFLPSFIVGAAQASSDREKDYDDNDNDYNDKKSYEKDRDRDDDKSRDHDKDYDDEEDKKSYGKDRDDDSRDYEKDNDDKKSYVKYKDESSSEEKDNEEKSYGKDRDDDSRDYEKDYKYDDDKKSYEKDNIKCNNFNLNLNGLDVDAIPKPVGNLLGEQAQLEDKDTGTGVYYGDGGGKERFVGYNNKDFAFVCKNNNNNNNEFIVSPTPPIPPTPVDIVCTVWEERDTITGLTFDVFFARSTDGGLTFSEPENLSENAGGSLQPQPQVICEGNNVYVVWFDDTDTPGNFEIFFTRSTDGGLTFSEPENISETTENSFFPQISSEGKNVYVVWEDGTDTPPPGNADIFFATSTDAGLTFSEPENISETTEQSLDPQISSEGNNVYVVWQDDTDDNAEIFFTRSTDAGLTFSEPENISETTLGSFEPQITSEGNNVYVVWTDATPGNADIFFATSTDGGLTFSEPENISENRGISIRPQISSEGNNVYVVWEDTTPGNPEIFFATSTDGGLTFSEPENISENTGPVVSFQPQISSEGNNVYVVWSNDTPAGTFDIFFARSTDGGLTFSEPENISENAGGSFEPQISSEDNNVYVVWEDGTGTPPGSNDIFFATSTNSGLTFSEPENISETQGVSSNPQISSSSSTS